jgi:hypothetical protein
MSTRGVETVKSSPWAAHRQRGEALRDRHPHAAEMLTLYLALLDTWEEAWRFARADRPEAGELAGWAADHVFPRVVTATVQFGPGPLRAAVGDLGASATIEPLLTGWLSGLDLAPVERYLARAVLRGPLEALDVAAVCARDHSPRGGRHCPSCGGRPQLSFRMDANDALVSGRRYLTCARCGKAWGYSSNACASCGETSGARRTNFAEHRHGPVVGRGNGRPSSEDAGSDPPLFPHLRIEACESCSRYLIDVDLGLDAHAVPEVDELTALPLDLFATERGLEKVAPNLMGF